MSCQIGSIYIVHTANLELSSIPLYKDDKNKGHILVMQRTIISFQAPFSLLK